MLRRFSKINYALTMDRADYMQGTRLSFKSKDDAIHFAEKQGWDYYVYAPLSVLVLFNKFTDFAVRLPKSSVFPPRITRRTTFTSPTNSVFAERSRPHTLLHFVIYTLLKPLPMHAIDLDLIPLQVNRTM